MKKRKFYAVSMAVILILSLFIQGCGKKASEVSDKSLQQTEQDERGDEMESLPDNTEELKD